MVEQAERIRTESSPLTIEQLEAAMLRRADEGLSVSLEDEERKIRLPRISALIALGDCLDLHWSKFQNTENYLRKKGVLKLTPLTYRRNKGQIGLSADDLTEIYRSLAG